MQPEESFHSAELSDIAQRAASPQQLEHKAESVLTSRGTFGSQQPHQPSQEAAAAPRFGGVLDHAAAQQEQARRGAPTFADTVLQGGGAVGGGRRYTPPNAGASQTREDLFDIFSQQSPFELHKRASFYEEDLWEKDSPLQRRRMRGTSPLEQSSSVKAGRSAERSDGFLGEEADSEKEEEETLKDYLVTGALILVLVGALFLIFAMQFMTFDE